MKTANPTKTAKSSSALNLDGLALRADCERLLKMRPYHERPNGIRLVAQKHGCSEKKVYTWIAKLERGKDPSHKAYGYHLLGKHHYISPEDTKAIERLVEANPNITAKQIIKTMPRVDCSAMTTVARIKKAVKQRLGHQR